MAEQTYDISGAGISVDLLIWRIHKKPVPGLKEAVFDANPGLADLGYDLPLGTKVTVPDYAPAGEAATIVGLWS